MAAETTSGFMIDGVLYEMPALDSFNLDEAQVMYDYSGITIEDFAPAEGVEPNEKGEFELDDEQKLKLKNPGFMRSLMHIAYWRGNPKMNEAKIKALIGKVNVIDVLQHLADQDSEGDALPPASTTTPDEPSPSSTPASSESSGTGSERSSGGQVVPLAPTTTTGSDTSSTPSLTNSVA